MNLIRRSMGALLRSHDHVRGALRAGCTDERVVCVDDTIYLQLNVSWKYAAFTGYGNPSWIGIISRPGDIVRTSPWGVGYELSTE